ncbi:hypothetical protein [Caulobacter sp.]|uniref:hypothetical protein n=1 Tax=Caulobacter sp. TaxID=78 RepID=UPI0031E1862F
MKHAVLASVGRNIAHSLASGIGLMIGVYSMDIFGEAAASPEGFIEVDFLSGATTGAATSASLARAISLYAAALPSLCKSHGVEVTDFEKLSAKYLGKGHRAEFVVTVTDRNGKKSARRYVGNPGARPIILDPLGRRRRVRSD